MMPVAGGWHVAEVKRTTSVKPYHLGDIATQLWVMQGCAVPVVEASIRHLDRDFVLSQAGHYYGLFTSRVVTETVAPLIATRSTLVFGARAISMRAAPIRARGKRK